MTLEIPRSSRCLRPLAKENRQGNRHAETVVDARRPALHSIVADQKQRQQCGHVAPGKSAATHR